MVADIKITWKYMLDQVSRMFDTGILSKRETYQIQEVNHSFSILGTTFSSYAGALLVRYNFSSWGEN